MTNTYNNIANDYLHIEIHKNITKKFSLRKLCTAICNICARRLSMQDLELSLPRCNSLSLLLQVLILFFFLPSSVNGQTWEDFADRYFSDGEYDAALYERLETLSQNKLNLNTATRSELLRLPFLSESQVDSLLSFREKKHQFIALGDLSQLYNLSYIDKANLLPFVFVAPIVSSSPSLWQLLQKGRHTFDSRIACPLYQSEGYKDGSYLGPPLYHFLRYKFRNGERLCFGGLMKTERGEPIGKYQNYPYDAMQGYVQYSTSHYTFLVGDYRLRAHEGLLFNPSSYNYKLSLATQPFNSEFRVTPHTSTAEYGFFRGGAFQRRKGFWQQSLAFSYQPIDARIENDTLRTFYYNGYHRTRNEIVHRRSAYRSFVAADMSFTSPLCHLALTAAYSRFSHYVSPFRRRYNSYALKGKEAFNMAFSYRWRPTVDFHMRGEVSTDRKGHLAFSQTLRSTHIPSATITLNHRHLSPYYTSLYGRTLQSNNHCANEHGITLAVQDRHLPHCGIEGYIEYAHFPTYSYFAPPHSNYIEGAFQLSFSDAHHNTFLFNYKNQTRQRRLPHQSQLVAYTQRHKLRSRYIFNLSSFVTLIPTLDATFYTSRQGPIERGWCASLRSTLNYKTYRCALFGALFFIPNYYTAIYCYTPSLRASRSVQAFHNNGYYITQTHRFQISPHLQISARHSLHHLFNNDYFSSGKQRVNRSTKNEIEGAIVVIL